MSDQKKRIIELPTANEIPDNAYFAIDSVVDPDDSDTGARKIPTNKFKPYKEVTQAEYDELPDSKLTDGVLYAISDGEVNMVSDVTVNGTSVVDEGVASITTDSTPTNNSTNPVQSGGVYTALSNKANTSDLSTVATSGSYNDLSDKPTIDNALSTSSENAVQNKIITENINSLYGDIADEYDTTVSYKFGDFVIYNNDFYSCIEATTGIWDATCWKSITVAELLDDIKTLINPLIKDIHVDELSHLIQNDELLDIMNYGDQFTINWADGGTNYDMPLNFCHLETVKDSDNNDVKVADFESNYVLPFDCVYDEPEAIVALDENQTLSAGDYYFKIANDSWGNNNGKYVCFTLSETLTAGKQIRKKSGAYNADISNCTLGIFTSGADRTGTELAFTVSTTQPSSGADLGQTDGTGYCNYWHCVVLGYNRWKYSAVRQFLNSDATAGSWWTQQHKWDVMPAYATSKNGFLYGLSESVKEHIKETKVVTARNTVFNSGDTPLGGNDETYDKVFLISLEQSYINPQVTGEGSVWEYYQQLNGTSTKYAQYGTYADLIKYDIGAKTTARYRWLRSAGRGGAYSVWLVYASGYVSSSHAINGFRVAPCLRIG